jgi:hypothetical protein
MENWLWGTRYRSGVETTDGVGGNTQWDEGCVVVEGVGGANHEFARVRGFVPKMQISSRVGSISIGDGNESLCA